jgi:hypothetical protein
VIKNAIIGFLSTALLFTNTILADYGFLVYLAMSAVAFVVVCAIEDMWEKHMNSIRLLERFKRDANRKITLNAPTKAS